MLDWYVDTDFREEHNVILLGSNSQKKMKFPNDPILLL